MSKKKRVKLRVEQWEAMQGLRALSAYRLMCVVNWQEARQLTALEYGQPLYDSEAGWAKAREFILKAISDMQPLVEVWMLQQSKVAHLDPLRMPLAKVEWDLESDSVIKITY